MMVQSTVYSPETTVMATVDQYSMVMDRCMLRVRVKKKY